jgi:hypothetical protein
MVGINLETLAAPPTPDLDRAIAEYKAAVSRFQEATEQAAIDRAIADMMLAEEHIRTAVSRSIESLRRPPA